MKRVVLVLINLLFLGFLISGSVVSVLATESEQIPTAHPTRTQNREKEIRRSQLQQQKQLKTQARKAYIEILKKANQDYKTAREQARGTLKTALKAAGKDKTARQTAIKAYNASLKEARQAMQASKKQALEN